MPELRAPFRVAVIGAGYFGRFHYDAWARIGEAELSGVCDTDTERAASVAAEFGGGVPLPVFRDAGEMVAALRPDLVDITTPPAQHAGLIRVLAPQVGHIICQKPFCGGVEGAREAVALCAAHGTRIAVNENVRFQPWHTEAKRLIRGGVLGDPFQVTFRLRPGDGQGPDAYLDRQPYFQRMPRFLVHETAVHWIDTFRYLMGEVTGVFARLVRLNPAIAGEDAGLILFDFANGGRGVFDGNRLSDHAAADRRRTLGEMWIEGPKGTLRLDGEGRLWLRPFGSNEEVAQRFEWRDHLFGGDCVHRCTRAIIGDWLAGRDSPMEGAAYLRNQEIEEAIYTSAATGRYVEVQGPAARCGPGSP